MGSSFDWNDHARRMRANGFWRDQTIDSLFASAVGNCPEKIALVCYRQQQAVLRLTFAELGDRVSRAAGALRRRGVKAGDVISAQLPNWWEFVVVALATERIGGVFNPLVPILREHEMNYLLAFCEAKVLVVPAVLRGFNHEAMARSLRPNLPALQQVVVAGGTGADSFDRVLQSGTDRVEPAASAARADALSLLMFTSGTTGKPKGVMHSSNTLNAYLTGVRSRLGLLESDVMLCCSPIAHMTAYAAALLQGLSQGSTVVLQDEWNPKLGVEIMSNEGVTSTAASTTFLADICDAVEAGAPRPRLRTFICGGAPIPPIQIERAARILNVPVSSIWGMTEVPGGTLTEPSRAQEKSSSTDGRALDGNEVRVVGGDGKPLPLGQTGTLMVRGATLMMGYYKRSDLEPFDSEGWLDTGDLAYMDSEGYIRINGRTKDIVIRGGENVPVIEIENLLYKHPAIAMAAVVGFPDSRLGERCCAFVTLREAAVFTLADLRNYMSSCRVAKQYWPERVEVIDSMPMTASGKIQKFQLRQRALGFVHAGV